MLLNSLYKTLAVVKARGNPTVSLSSNQAKRRVNFSVTEIILANTRSCSARSVCEEH